MLQRITIFYFLNGNKNSIIVYLNTKQYTSLIE